jgi:hypothetical protein
MDTSPTPDERREAAEETILKHKCREAAEKIAAEHGITLPRDEEFPTPLHVHVHIAHEMQRQKIEAGYQVASFKLDAKGRVNPSN